MRLQYDDIAFVLDQLELPAALEARLRRSRADVDMSEEDAAMLNDACIARLQEHGFDQRGNATPVGRRLERIIDALNED